MEGDARDAVGVALQLSHRSVTEGAGPHDSHYMYINTNAHLPASQNDG